jgi:hypothetical protein
VTCVISRCFGAQGERFHRGSLRFHPHLAVPLQHATVDVPCNGQDRGI